MNKDSLRKKYLDIRKNIECRGQSDFLIQKYVKEVSQKYSSVFSYYASGSEADIEDAFSSFSGRVYCPVSYENSVMEFFECNGKTKIGMYGIKEPCGDKADITPDVVFVPGVAFDKSGGRIGYGKGYYDRFLSCVNTLKIGVCFDEQLSCILFPCDKFDIKMDMIITQSGILTCGKE